jgi:transglutaminase-like putative cysteine protease
MLFAVRCILAMVVLVGAVAPAVQAQARPDVPFIDKLWHGAYDVAPDGRVTQTVTARYQVLQPSMLEKLRVYEITHAPYQRAEVLEAHTLKSNGQQFPAAAPVVGVAPDRVAVRFPELAVGDILHIRYRLTDREAVFPGQFALAMTFSPFGAYEDVRITVRAPRDMTLTSESHFFRRQPAPVVGDVQVLEWRYANMQPPPQGDEEGGIWRLAEVPGVFVSTFRSYEAIASAYAALLAARPQPTPKVTELARDLLGRETRPREKARLMYDWVASQIAVRGPCMGMGPGLPRELDEVLASRSGSCNEHATLLQAMLTAVGVRSEQVLVNGGSNYELPVTPVAPLINHVVNYLTDLDLYVDPGAGDIPFGYLPPGLYAKPAVHVSTRKLAATPHEGHARNEQRVDTKMKLAESGAATGSVRVALKGVQAALARAYHRDLPAGADTDFVRRVLASFGYRGRGTLEKGPTQGLADEYAYEMKFEIDNYLPHGPAGKFLLAPVVDSPFPVVGLAETEHKVPPKRPEPCYGFHTYETYEIELADGLSLPVLPPDAEVRSALLDYVARHQREARVVRVAREAHDKTTESICTPAMAAEFLKQAAPVARNLRTSLEFRRGTP